MKQRAIGIGGLGDLLHHLLEAAGNDQGDRFGRHQLTDRNQMAQKLVLGIHNKSREALKKKAVELKPILEEEIIGEIVGLKGAFSRLKRVTGNDYPLIYERDSEVGMNMSDKLKATGIQYKMDWICEQTDVTLVKIDMVATPTDALRILADFKESVIEKMAEIPCPVKFE